LDKSMNVELVQKTIIQEFSNVFTLPFLPT